MFEMGGLREEAPFFVTVHGVDGQPTGPGTFFGFDVWAASKASNAVRPKNEPDPEP